MKKRVLAFLMSIFMVIFCVPSSGTAASDTYVPNSFLTLELSLDKGYSLLLFDENETMLKIINGFSDENCDLPAEYDINLPAFTGYYFIPVKQVVTTDENGNSVTSYVRQVFSESMITQGTRNKESIPVPEGTNTFYILPSSLIINFQFDVAFQDAPYDEQWDGLTERVLNNLEPEFEEADSTIDLLIRGKSGFEEILLNQNEGAIRTVRSPRGEPTILEGYENVVSIELIEQNGDLYTYEMKCITHRDTFEMIYLQYPGEHTIKAWNIYANPPEKKIMH